MTQPPVEEPVLGLEEYAIAFHLAAKRNACGPSADDEPPADQEDESAEEEKKRRERAMRSFEDDMLLYAHRDSPPFRTDVVAGPIHEVTVHFARELTYESEGGRITRRCADATEDGRKRRFRLSLAETKFFDDGEVAILTLVLTPVDPPDELNEYDVIKLAKLWEGGEGVEGAPSAIDEGSDLSFSTGVGSGLTLDELARRLFPGWTPLAYEKGGRGRKAVEKRTTARDAFRVGTLELALPASASATQLFRDIAIMKKRRVAPRRDRDRWNQAVALGGILQGLLDFRRIEPHELADVFAKVDVGAEDETMHAFHKGTLLSLGVAGNEEDEAKDKDAEAEVADNADRVSPIGIDPYLAVPNIVLLHDEQRLKTARLQERDLSSRQDVPLWAIRRWNDRAAIGETQNGLGELAGLLAQHLPNVFHYPSERQLQDQGRQSRGLDDLEIFIRRRMDDLSNVLQSRVRTRDRWTAAVGIAAGVIVAFLIQQVIEGRPLWLVVLAVGLFVLFLLLRDRLF